MDLSFQFWKLIYFIDIKFEILSAVSMKITLFCVVAEYSLEEVRRRFKRSCVFHHPPDGGK